MASILAKTSFRSQFFALGVQACHFGCTPAPKAPAAAATPPKAAPAEKKSTPTDSKHSTDIAFKPTDGGWGYNPRYSNSWDNIFGKKQKQVEVKQEATAAIEKPSDEDMQTLTLLMSKFSGSSEFQSLLGRHGFVKK